MEISIASFFFAGAARRSAVQPQAASTDAEASSKLDDILAKYDPHNMSRREAFSMMKEMEQNGLLPPGRSALDMTALHRPGESVWNINVDAKFDVVEAVRANYAYTSQTASVDANSKAFVKAQFDVWNMVAARAVGRGLVA
jgi:hypothetical protein